MSNPSRTFYLAWIQHFSLSDRNLAVPGTEHGLSTFVIFSNYVFVTLDFLSTLSKLQSYDL